LAFLLAGTMLFGMTACKEKDSGGNPSGGGTGGNGSTETKSPDSTGEEKPEETKPTVTNSASGSGATEINFWTFTDETKGLVDDYFLKDNPDFATKYTIKWNLYGDQSPYRTAINADLGSASGPHLFVADVDYARKFAELSGTASYEDLGVKYDASLFYTYTLDLCKNNGKIMGLSHQATPGAMYYRADIAEEVLGVKTAEEMQALVSDWDKFTETAQKLGEAKVPMIYGTDELKRNFMNNREEGWVVDGVFNVDEEAIDSLVDTVKKIKEAGALKNNGNGQWSDAWKAGMREDVFSYFGSTWYLHYTIKPNAIKEHDDKYYDANGWDKAVGDGTFGKWGMIQGPKPFYWGGTYWFGSTTAAQDEDVKAGVAQLLEYFLSVEGQTAIAKGKGDFMSIKSINEELANDPAYENPFFLDKTNHYKVFAEAAKHIDISKNITKYDADYDAVLMDFLNNVFAENMSVEDAKKQMYEDAKSAVNDVTVVE